MTVPPTLKIAHIDTGGELRERQQQILMLARGLRELGHHQTVITPQGSGLNRRAREEGFSILDLPADNPRDLLHILVLRGRLRRSPVNILHAHDGAGQTITSLASLGMPVRRVASRRAPPLLARRLDFRLKYRYSCHAVTAVSRWIARSIEEFGIPPGMIHVIPQGIEIPPALPNGAARLQARARWGLSEGEFVIGHLASFGQIEGQDLVAQVFHALRDQRPEARLLLAASSPKEVADLTLRAGSADPRIRVLACQDDPRDFFAALDLFIMPSRPEEGTAVLQAMSYALPVVAARAGGLPEIVQEGATGWLVEPDSPGAFARAITAAASDPSRLRNFGSNGRELSKTFSDAAMVQRTIALYGRLMKAAEISGPGN